ncbi:MAG: DUF2800 domain-containing protein [Nitrospinaceae bacterium]
MILRPSNAHIWTKCFGWYHFVQKAPLLPDSGAHSIEGTQAHELAAGMLWGTLDDGSIEVDYPEEMIEAVLVYVEDIGDQKGLMIEDPIEFDGIPGTPDAWGVDGDTLTVWDFKYGRGLVEVFENPQLIIYASALFQMLKFSYDGFIDMRVVQPRGFHRKGPVRSWKISVAEFAAYTMKIRHAKNAALEGGNLTPGKQCKYCEVRHCCPALQSAVMSAVGFSEQPDLDLLSPESVGIELQILHSFRDHVSHRITGIEAQATAFLKGGKIVPGYRLEEGRGNKTWNAPMEQVISLGELLGVPLEKPGVITPAQAVKKKMDETVVAAMSHRPKQGLKLVPDDGNFGKELFKNE